MLVLGWVRNVSECELRGVCSSLLFHKYLQASLQILLSLHHSLPSQHSPQQGVNLPMDVEGSPSSGGAGSAGTTGFSSVSNSESSMPTSPTISPPQDVQGSHDDNTSSGEATPGVDGSNSNSSSVKLSLANDDNFRGSEPASLLAIQANDNKAGSKPTTPVVVAHVSEKSDGGSKPASLAAVVVAACESESDKEKGNDKLSGGDLDGGDDAAGDSDGDVGSNSKSIKSSSDDGDVQGVVIKDDAPTPAAVDGGGNNNKGKSVVVEGEHAPHYWMERERRKKMKNLYNTLHSLLPRFPQKADKVTIAEEIVDYIKTLKGTLKGLEELKLERIRAQLFGASSSHVAPLPPPMCHGGAPPPAEPRESTLADMVNSWNTEQAEAVPHGPFHTWSAPNIAVNVTGNESFINVCVPRQSGVVTKVLCVLHKYHIDVITLNISSDKNRSIFSIHTRVKAAPGHIALQLMTAEDRYKLVMSELLQWISAN